ncbi:MAG TPA: hypothetical protein VLJ88_11170 [Propionibacteriaceae bacterium]|nr:hypothetical protein [Propionibacteriaceae bacterium]
MPRSAPVSTRRCIHLVDIENLLGGWVTDQRTRHLVARYHGTGLIGSADLVIVAGAHRAAARWAFAAPQGWRRIITADEPDAADDALVKAGQAYAFSPTTHLVIGSGDHYFVPVAETARAAGAQIHGLIGEGQLAPRLAVLFDAITQIALRIRPRPVL